MSDERLFQAGDGTLLLSNWAEQAIYESPVMRAHLERIGLARTCAIANEAVKLAVSDRIDAFRPALVAAMRSQIPADRFDARRWLSLQGALAAYRGRVEDALLRDAAPVYEGVRALALTRFQRETAIAAAVAGSWADIFADWDLSRTNAVRTACMLYQLSDPVMAKRPFDQFYQRKEMH
ncbi:hypothetical protein IAG41_14775 [Sphingomonas sp. JC676]|uniref:hypothetical protein n=1 Tax=Sphingomonas sp. JC676 TaxID=2768065 RepID=UPI001657C502|nr:hypothetical protein [Sphingomonas sp. JC676]MBC9033659.1 hypothetical protein [Sphingomonas sp. JC676]